MYMYMTGLVYLSTEIVVILLEQPQVSVSEDDGQATICMNVEGLITTEVTVSLSVNGGR